MKQLGFINYAVEWQSILMDKWLMICEYTNVGSPVFKMKIAYGNMKI